MGKKVHSGVSMGRKLTGVLYILVLVFCLTACGNSSAPEQKATSEPTEESPLPSPKMETITVFTIDPDSMAVLPSRVKKKEDDDSLMYITELVLNNLEDDNIRVSEVSMEEDKAIIVFDSTGKPVTDCDADMEGLILECFANSILDNVEGCHGVIFRTDKGAYASENITMKKDEVYASR